MTEQPIPYDPECPHCGWPHTMKNVSAAVVCHCDTAMWWVYDIQNQVFRLAPLGKQRWNDPNLVRYWHPDAAAFIRLFDDMLFEVWKKRTGRRQYWSEQGSPHDEALWQEGAEE